MLVAQTQKEVWGHWSPFKVITFTFSILQTRNQALDSLGNFFKVTHTIWELQIKSRYMWLRASQGALVVKNLSASAGDRRDSCSIPGSGRSPGGGHGNPLQYSCLKNPHGQRRLAGYSPWRCKELDMTLRGHASLPWGTRNHATFDKSPLLTAYLTKLYKNMLCQILYSGKKGDYHPISERTDYFLFLRNTRRETFFCAFIRGKWEKLSDMKTSLMGECLL